VFAEFAFSQMENLKDVENVLSSECSNGHSFVKIFDQIAKKMFNAFIKNMCSEENANLHKSKKRNIDGKSSSGSRKITKLQST